MSGELDFNTAMLEALKRRQPVALRMVKGLLDKLRSITSMPHPLEERRTVARLECDFQVVVLLPGDRALGAHVTDISLFGMSLELHEELAPGTRVRLLLAHDDSLEEVACKVRGCRPGPKGFECGLVYHQDAERLSRSWVCTLLRELGYDIGHLQQRRAFIRVKTDLPAQIEAGDGMFEGRVIDLGVGGALLKCEQELPDHEEVRLLLDATAGDPLALEAHPLHHRDEGLHSLQFPRPDRRQYERLGGYILNALKKLED